MRGLLIITCFWVLGLPAQVVSIGPIQIRLDMPEIAVAGGGITRTALDSGDLDSATADSNSISPAADSHLILFYCYARTSFDPTDNLTASGPTGLTWNNLDFQLWGVRRACWIFRGDVDGSPGSGVVDLDCSSCAGTFSDVLYSIVQYEGLDNTTPLGTIVSNGDTVSSTSESVTVSGTPDSGDFLYTAFAHENANKSLTEDSDFGNRVHSVTGGAGIRQILVGDNSSPPASPVPDISWSGNNHSSGVSFILNVSP